MLKKELLLASTFFIASFLFGQEGSEIKTYNLKVEDAVELAFENNISIKKSKLNLDLLKKKKNSSWNSISPSLSLSGNYGGTNTGTLDQWKDDKVNSSNTWSAGASVTIAFTPSLFTAIKAAKLAYESGESSYESMVRSVELSVRKSFYSLLYTKENIALQENALETARLTYESNKTKYNLGRLSELDLLTSQYSYESKKPSIDTLKNSYNNSLDSFKQVLGIPLSDKIELEGNLEDLINIKLDEEILNQNYDQIPSVKSLLAQIEAQKNSLQASRMTAWGPSLTASSTASLAGNDKTDDSSLTMNYSLGVRIPLDGYLPWSSGAMSIASQKTNLKSLELDLENARTSAAITIRNSYNAVNQAMAQLSNYERNVDLMQRTYEMTKKSYNAGSSSLSALQSAEENLASAKYNLQAQRYAIISALLDLENTLGVPFGTYNSKKE